MTAKKSADKLGKAGTLPSGEMEHVEIVIKSNVQGMSCNGQTVAKKVLCLLEDMAQDECLLIGYINVEITVREPVSQKGE